MYVKYYMTKEPKTISPDTPVSKALDIMSRNNFHRLPVVDEAGKLVGLVTAGLVTESSGKNLTSLDIYELNYILSRTKASDIMITDVAKTYPDVFLEEAADEMLNAGVNAMPVVDENNVVVGIITEKDMFSAFTEIMGLKHQGTKFVIKVNDKPGEFAECAKLFGDADANLESIAVYHTERGAEVVIKATGEIPVEDMAKILQKAGFEIYSIVQTTNEGERVVWDIPEIN